MYEYDGNFYGFLSSFALKSARRVVPKLMTVLPVRSVADFGCGQGAWLCAWSEARADVLGVDGPYVDRRHMLIDAERFRAADLSHPIDLERHFDLVQSLEVAEHLPAAKAENFIDTLVAHAPIVLFSAALPGQGGENHVNEQPLEYWRDIFRSRGYVPVDYLRPLIAGDPAVQSWYRYNMLLYVEAGRLGSLPDALQACLVRTGDALREYRPLTCRLQQALVRRLPVSTVNRISRFRAAVAVRRNPGAARQPMPAP